MSNHPFTQDLITRTIQCFKTKHKRDIDEENAVRYLHALGDGFVSMKRLIAIIKSMPKSKLIRMDNVGIVVESLDTAISFFEELGMKLEGRMMVEGEWAGRVTGLGDQSVEIAMMATPDGSSRIELSRFIAPATISDHRNAPVNSLGYLRVMFAVEDLRETLARLEAHGAKLVGEVTQFGDMYLLCYLRGPEGIMIALAEQLGDKSARDVLEKAGRDD